VILTPLHGTHGVPSALPLPVARLLSARAGARREAANLGRATLLFVRLSFRAATVA